MLSRIIATIIIATFDSRTSIENCYTFVTIVLLFMLLQWYMCFEELSSACGRGQWDRRNYQVNEEWAAALEAGRAHALHTGGMYVPLRSMLCSLSLMSSGPTSQAKKGGIQIFFL